MDISPLPPLKPVATAIRDVTGRRPPPATWRRWVRIGMKGQDNTRIKLRTVKIGGRLYCADAYVREFIEATSSAPSAEQPHPPTNAVYREIASEYLARELGSE